MTSKTKADDFPPSNAPEKYICPVCLGVKGVESPNTMLLQSDLVYQDELVSVFINSFFLKQNAGHAIVVPNEHFESLYTVPAEYGHRIFEVSQKVALATKNAYGCDGITIRQNNEPAGDQHAFHYHMHVYPRYHGDNFNNPKADDKLVGEPAERAVFAERLKRTFSLL